VLGVERNATESDLKKAFKKRAIKVHPDKNPYPKATDAFKKVNAAMACLSDADKRRTYDQVGTSEAFE
jgi:DnaJ family protein B protein 12